MKKLLIGAVVVFGLTACGDADGGRFNAWISACMAEGGHVAMTHYNGGNGDWYECFRDDQIIQVPGFEDWDD